MKLLAFFTILTALTLPATVRSQSDAKFVSLPGGFAVSLPADGFSEGGAHGTAGGIYYGITTKQAKFEVGFYETNGLPMAMRDGEFSFELMAEANINRLSRRGERISESKIVLQGYEGREYHFASNSEHHFFRLWLAGDRVFNIVAETRDTGEANVRLIRGVFDSFEILDPKFVAEKIEQRLKENTPADLPQKPAVTKKTSDSEDQKLRGRVRSVLDEYSPVNLKGGALKPRRRAYQEFDENGRLLKRIDFDNLGNPFQVRVYGFVAGKRVARLGPTIRYGGIVSGILIGGTAVRRSEPRFDEFYKYVYVGTKLTEERCYDASGGLQSRVAYKHRPGIVEISFFNLGGRIGQRRWTSLDKDGNESEVKISTPSSTFEPESRYRFRYDVIDGHGNWTKRTLLKWYGYDGEGTFQVEEIQSRTITYFD